ncbi:hypothetical protein KFL_002440040 [Klebsormidium nitens]|uniref:PH domain-containing protein n=1 Tax=Klebsormidium nitens TaxID=105231 RepID=A0A1Y1IBY2_KLENI|nr:hypothetical protein KFL_002440040 [Klebsormidium nitens]|eukprot:GAQ85598.1 hypothetical protein KFL_002440040 [Klebsormidium nitens]
MAKSAIKEIAKLSMENLETLWAHPDKSGILMKRGGDIQTWKRRYFVVKDTFLFYFKSRQDLSAPAGVVPIQNCHVEAADSRNAPTDWVFRVTLTNNEKLGEVKRKEYFLAATDSDDLSKWIDAVRCASDSKGHLRQQVDQAREEVRNLEQRWLAASAADAGMPIASMSPAQAGQDDAVVVAALTEELRSAQLLLEAAQRKLAAANARSEQHLRQIQQVEAMTAE